MRLLSDTNKLRRRYQEILQESPGASVYQTVNWLSVFKSMAADLMFVEADKDVIVPFVCKGRGLLRRAYSLPFDTYGGPVATVRNGRVSFERIMQELNLPSVRIVDYSDRIKTGNGHRTAATTHIIDVEGGYASVCARYSDANKRALRRAADRGVRVKPMGDESELDIFYRLYVGTVARYNAWPFPRDFFTALYRLMVPSGLARFSLAWKDDRAIAGNLVLRFNGEACDWMWVYDAEYRELRATNALIDHAIREEIERGAHRVNLGCSPDARLGSVRFKKGFGAEEYRYNIFSQRGRCFNAARLLKNSAGRIPSISGKTRTV